MQSNLKYYTEPAVSQAEVDPSLWQTKRVVWTYNSDSLNERFEYAPQKSQKTYRIITLGDSFTFGDHVSTMDNWTEKLEDLLNTEKICPNFDKYEVINLGVCGYDIQYEVERYKLRGQKYNPNLVIWMLINNDFEEINELSMPLQNKYYEQLKKEHKLDPLYPYRESDELGREEFLRLYNEKQRFALEDSYFSDFSKLYQGPLLLVTYPFLGYHYKIHMQQWAEQRDHSYYEDSLPDLYASDELSFKAFLDLHPTALAHQLIAQKMYQYIVDNSLISCK